MLKERAVARRSTLPTTDLSLGNESLYATTLSFLSFRPERTRISCHAALETTACAAFRKESRMTFANATNINRKSGVAEGRNLLCAIPVPQNLPFYNYSPLVIPPAPTKPWSNLRFSPTSPGNS